METALHWVLSSENVQSRGPGRHSREGREAGLGAAGEGQSWGSRSGLRVRVCLPSVFPLPHRSSRIKWLPLLEHHQLGSSSPAVVTGMCLFLLPKVPGMGRGGLSGKKGGGEPFVWGLGKEVTWSSKSRVSGLEVT